MCPAAGSESQPDYSKCRVGAPSAGRRAAHLTVLFCDLVDSTEIAGRLDPEDWRDIAAQYQETAAAAVTRFGGHVAKYLGDGLMVYFGWPEAHEDDAERAVRGGLAIRDNVAALNGRFTAQHKVKLPVRLGIQTGSVVVGHGGGEEADVFGEAPNVASRVQSVAEPDSVLMTAAVRARVGTVRSRIAVRISSRASSIRSSSIERSSPALHAAARMAQLSEPLRPSSGGKTSCGCCGTDWSGRARAMASWLW